MRVRINSIGLEGTTRRVSFEPGLNIVTGPIASGKTTFLTCARGLIGGSFSGLPPEARESVRAVSGDVTIGSSQFSVIRPAVTTSNARVDIAGDDLAIRIPASRPEPGSRLTYLHWLLERLDLPRLEVPSAPTKPDSEPTPVSLRDYLRYCTLYQDELGFSVFGHTDFARNIKRKYVFEIIYGLYSVETARVQDELREVLSKLRVLRNQDELFSDFLKGTALENRADIDRALQAARRDLDSLEQEITAAASPPRADSATEELQRQILALEAKVEDRAAKASAERASAEELEQLAAQLEAQAGKITRSIVAQKHLLDIEFVVCPRCGSEVSHSRGDDSSCYLCLQEPQSSFSREVLIEELGRVESQISEARDLLGARSERAQDLEEEARELRTQLETARTELDFQTRAFVSEQADQIASMASRRAELKAQEKQLGEYLGIFRKLDESRDQVASLERRRDELQVELDSASGHESEVQARIARLNEYFNEILEKFKPPEFGEEATSHIDRKTYLPIYHGRRFDDLSSPGLGTLVNVAHALAHQRAAIELGLSLPNILFIDGLSEHLGEEGLDPERQEAIYDHLIETSEELGDLLQIIAIDNQIPPQARQFVRLELSDSDKLIPLDSQDS
ncbi:MAG: AAA family ATPase [Myxococcota bacterium]